MFRRVLLAAVLSGIAAALVMSAVQHLRVTPLILEAETYEMAEAAPAAAHTHDDSTAAATAHTHEHEHEHGAPMESGPRRLALTVIANGLTGVAFALILAATALVVGLPLTTANGALWGLLGFITFSLAPAAGLPPELPGMPAGDLAARQLWWAGTALATGAGILLIAKRQAIPYVAAAVALIALPHLIGAPAPVSAQSAVPPYLASTFAANALATAALFWLLIGVFLGKSLNFTNKD